jgi:hypothetical protein
MNSKWIAISLIFFGTVLHADETGDQISAKDNKPNPIQPYAPPPPPTPPPSPWLTGTIISATGYVIPWGNVEIEGYVYANTTTGAYNNHWANVSAPHNFYQVATQVYGYFGITSFADVQIIPQSVVNHSNGKTSVEFSDLPIALDFQIFPYDANSSFPGVKLSFKETFPTGRYQRLNPNKNGTQVSGAGTYASNATVYFYKVYNTNGNHFLSVNLNFGYTVNSMVTVHGFNAYGGGYGARGLVSPGSILQAIASFEYTLSQNWVLSIDNVYTHTYRTYFFGNPGTLANGSAASAGAPSSDWIAFCPSIEYNFSAAIGINVGAYVTAWGRNAPVFRNGIAEVCYNY